MKFTCDSCGAQYMISDEKVGPGGVKVRCKKCGHVIPVRRVAEEPVVAAATANGAGAGNGLDDELGQAFDNAFGDPSAAAPGPDPAEAQGTGGDDDPSDPSDDAPVPSAGAASVPAATEWYVAIGQAQVGPLPLGEVKRKWETGDVGPDSLVWRPGMGDWQPLTAVSDLAGYLAPVPRAAPRLPREVQPQRSEPQPARERAAETPAPVAAAREDVSWKPAGASALATLASEEIAARTPEARPAVAAGAAGGVRSLVDGLPDGGGVDPTGALPLSIKALETTGEKKVERRSTVASRAEETRHKRSVTRLVAIGVAAVVLIVGGAAAYVVLQARPVGAPVPAVAAAPAVAPPAAPPPAAPPQAAAPAEVAPPAPPAEPVASAPPAPPPVAEPAPPPEKPVAAKPPPPPPRKVARAEPPPPRQAPAPSPPAPTPTVAKKKDSLLDFDSNDSALDEALGGSSSGRSVYVPPARTGGGALPDKLSPAQINESVAGRIDALRRCVSEQKRREPDASGVLKMRWVIAGDGSVRDVKTLTSEYATSPFAQCITGVVKSIRFPRSTTTGQEVTFPFSF